MHQSQHPLTGRDEPNGSCRRILGQGSPAAPQDRDEQGKGWSWLRWPQQVLEESRGWKLCQALPLLIPGLGGSAPTAASMEQLSLPSWGTGNVQRIPLKTKTNKTIWVINKRVTWSLGGAAVLPRGLSQEPLPAR